MKKQFINFFFIFSLFISSFCYAVSYQTGDIIFQTSKSAQSSVIQKATHSPYSHMGMLVNKNGQWWVLEAIQPVKYTALDAWIQRGVKQQFVVKRYHHNLSTTQQAKLVQDAEKYLGKPYDIYFEWSDSAIYCSEIVWKAYKQALGVELAPLERLKDFDLTDPQVKSLMKQRYGQKVPMQEKVISPKAIFESKQLVLVK